MRALGLPRFPCYNVRGCEHSDDSTSMLFQERSSTVAAVALLLAVGIAGCSSVGSTDWFPSIPGFSNVVTTSADRTALAQAQPAPSMNDNCPPAEIRQGASTLAIAAKTQQPTASDLRYQLSITQLARQCALEGPEVRMRVGVQGRVIVGPAGAPNQVDVPLRYAVVREGVEPKTITSKFRRIPVSLAQGATNVMFTDIEEDLRFPVPSPAELDAYVVYIGFDDAGDRNRPPPAKKAPPKKK
jgi:hypothetical protein